MQRLLKRNENASGGILGSKNAPANKEEKFNRVYAECLRLIHEKDINAVTHSNLARSSKVSRSWIYKYMGLKRDTIIKHSTQHFSQYFAESSLQAGSISNKEELISDIIQGTRKNLDFTLGNRFTVPLYIRFAGTENILGETIKELEILYKRRLIEKFTPFLQNNEKCARLAHGIKLIRIGAALEFGTLSPDFLNGEEREKSMNKIDLMQISLIESYFES